MKQRRIATLLIAITMAACGSHDDMLPQDRSDSAQQVIVDSHARRSEYGRLQIELDAPLVRKYDKPRPVTKYDKRGSQRVQLRLYDDSHRLKTSIEAGHAVSFDDRDIMQASDSVVVIDYSNGDTIYLQDLIWNSAEDRIYSNNVVRAKNGNRLTIGDGFRSDQRMENLQILHQRGVIEFND